MSLTDVLTITGGVTLCLCLMKLSWSCWIGFRQYFLSEYRKVDLRTYGQWAVVTGATSGIGKAYATELASRGLDIVLVSRSDEKLQTVAKEIERQYGQKTRTITVDFTVGHTIYPIIAEGLQGLDIGILVNNVGMCYADNFVHFLDIPDPDQKITDVVNCNMLSVAQMSRLVLPGMIQRKKGLIINISSEVGEQTYPLLTLYSASKSFVTYLSRGLHAEYKSKGITVQCVAPFSVSSNMTHNVEVNCLVKSATGFARDALNTVGYSTYTSGCLSHALQNVALTTLLPDWVRFSEFFLGKCLQLAQVARSKRAKEQAEHLREKEE